MTGRPCTSIAGSLFAATCVFVTASCGGSGPEASATTVSDSAGVALVEASAQQRALPWVAERVFTIPSLEEDGDGFFSVSDLVVTGGDRIAVLDRDGHRVVLFDGEGNHLAQAGEQGGGPGEFQYPFSMFARADGGVSVFDLMNARLETFDASLEYTESEILGGTAFFGGAVADLGTVRVVSGRDPGGSATERILAVSAADTVEIVRSVRADGATVTLESCGMQLGSMRPIFSPRTLWAAGPEGEVFVSDTDRFEIDVYRAPDFDLVRRIRRHVPVQAANADLALATVGDGMRMMTSAGTRTCDSQEVVEQQGFAPTIPSIANLIASPTGELFVSRWALPDEAPPIDVFSVEGNYIGTLPAGFPFPDAFLADGRFVVTEEDELGIQSVEVYSIRK